MKIMYIIKSFAMKAGVERVISDKMNYLVEHGYEVIMVTYEQGNHPHAFLLNPSIPHYNIDARFFKLSQMPVWRRPLERKSMCRRFKKGLQAAIDQEQPDIIIATTYSMKLLGIILKVRTNAHRLLESHIACYTVRKAFDYREKPLLKFFAALYDKMVFARIRKFEKLIVLTQGDAHDWKQYIDNVTVIPNPVTLYPDEVLPHDGKDHRIIAAGRLHEQKGFDLLIDSFAFIADKCPGWRIDIYGSGEDEQKLQDSIRQNGLEGRINILPPTSDIYKEYQRSDFLVMSSRYEGFGLVLVEAMSCGIPCVSFRCKYGPEEIIHDGEDGLLVKDGNIEELATKMLWMIRHDEERLQMGEKARQTARSYEKDTVMREWITLFDC